MMASKQIARILARTNVREQASKLEQCVQVRKQENKKPS